MPGRALAHGHSGILSLTPQGWIPVTDFDAIQLISDPLRRSHFFAFRHENFCDQQLYESLDEGLSWTPVAKDLHHRISSLAVLRTSLKRYWEERMVLVCSDDKGIRTGNLQMLE